MYPCYKYQLISTDHAIDDESFKNHLLASLPSAYSTLVEILQEREGSLTFPEVIHKVLQAEMAKSQKSSEGLVPFSTTTYSLEGEGLLSTSGTPSPSSSYRHTRSLYTKSNIQGQNRRTPYSRPFPGNCNKCGERGHKAASCSQPLLRPSSTVSALHNLQCFSCGEAGHGTKLFPHSSLTQSQAAKGRVWFEKWLSTCNGSSGSVMAASASIEPEGTPIGEPSQF